MKQATDMLRALYEAISRGDFDGVVQYLHPEVEIHPAVGGELDFSSTYRGREGMRQFMETAWRGFDVAVEPEQLITAPATGSSRSSAGSSVGETASRGTFSSPTCTHFEMGS